MSIELRNRVIALEEETAEIKQLLDDLRKVWAADRQLINELMAKKSKGKKKNADAK
jgi:uncharacterized coiled-coil protein SlyX